MAHQHRGFVKLPPRATIWQLLCRRIQTLILISEDNPETHIFFRSRSKILAEKHRQMSMYPNIIHPLSKFRRFWRTIMFFVWMIILPCDVYTPSFAIRMAEEGRNVDNLFLLMLIMNLICNVDFVLNFFTGYINTNEKIIVLKHSKIIFHYLRTFFFVDLLSFTMIIHLCVAQESDSTAFRIIYCMQFLRLLRLYTALDNMKIITRKFRISDYKYRVMCWTFFGLYLLHFNACLICLVPDAVYSLSSNERKDWINQLGGIYEGYGRVLHAHFLYAHCILRALNTYNIDYKCACLSIIAVQDIITEMVCISCAAIFFTFLFLRVMYWLNIVYSPSLEYKKQLEQMKDFLAFEGIPLDVRQSFIKYFETTYQTEYFNERRIVESFFPKQILEIHTYFSKILFENSDMFADFTDEQLVELSSRLKWFFMHKGRTLEFGAQTNMLYFVISGELACFDAEGEEVCHVRDGGTFGANLLLLRKTLPHSVTSVLALETCELCSLTRKDFREIKSDRKYLRRSI